METENILPLFIAGFLVYLLTRGRFNQYVALVAK